MRKAYRLCQKKWAHEAFTGNGAKIRGMRWNYKDVPVVYVSEHLSLAALEIVVNLPKKALNVPFVFFTITIPDHVKITRINKLPVDWRKLPFEASTQNIGLKWILEGRTAVLEVPSAVIPQENNFVLNPMHPDFKDIIISSAVDHLFDPRLK